MNTKHAHKLRKAQQDLRENPAQVDPLKPLPLARAMLEAGYSHPDHPKLVRWSEKFYEWDGKRYVEREPELMRKNIYGFIESTHPKGVEIANSRLVNEVHGALVSETKIVNSTQAPTWLVAERMNGAVIALDNGALDPIKKKLYPASPAFFNLHASAVKYDPKAKCPRWKKFVDEILDDVESKQLLQEWIGYLISGRTDQQKGLIIKGEKRSGKGTIVRVIEGLLGQDNVYSPTFDLLCAHFGLDGAVGKPLIVVPDARVSTRIDHQMVASRLLSIIANDAITLDRKHIGKWIGALNTRMMIVSNEFPAVIDPAGALMSRFLVLDFPHSFYGRGDTTLSEKLSKELSGVLNWALEGLERLNKRGRFVEPMVSDSVKRTLVRKSTPVMAFIEDCLIYDANHWVEKDALYGVYRDWIRSEGHEYALHKARFFEELGIVSERRLRTSQQKVRVGKERVNVVTGCTLEPKILKACVASHKGEAIHGAL